MSRRALLVGSAMVVAALIAGLVVLLRSSQEARPRTAEAPGPAAAPASTVEPPASRTSPAAAPSEPPRPVPLPPVEEPAAPGAETVDRDHRLVARTAPPGPLASATIADVRQVVEPAVRACAAGIEVQPAAPVRMVVHARLKVAGGRVSASDVSLTGAEAMGPEFASCVARVYGELQTDALPEQSEGEDLVHMPWTFP